MFLRPIDLDHFAEGLEDRGRAGRASEEGDRLNVVASLFELAEVEGRRVDAAARKARIGIGEGLIARKRAGWKNRRPDHIDAAIVDPNEGVIVEVLVNRPASSSGAGFALRAAAMTASFCRANSST